MASKRIPEVLPPLWPASIALLLRGWGSEAPVPGPHGFGGGMLELVMDHDAGFIRLWRLHETELRATARTWGWEPTIQTPAGLMFYSEALAAGYDPDEDEDEDE